MENRKNLQIYNSLSGKKEKFEPLHDNFVGMYVCGPTLYSEPHMGNMRTFINFDLIYRYFLHLGYKVKYVRNITDAGHITNSAGHEEDSIGKAARLEQMQSLEIVYKYNVKFQELQRIYNLLPPSIEPTATGHIQEQIEIIEQLIENGYAYEVNGSVYFDTKKYMQDFNYGTLSGRKVDELENETRALNAQDEKRFFADFALWKKANPEDMQIWRSPWGDGNPGWHIECTAMSTKYLGKHFDIHGGGMDLKFPHHEDEIAQSCGSFGCNPAKYWLHANMLNVNGQKMSKSFGNYFLPKEIIEGTTSLFKKAYPANVLRFFMMQAHYRSTLDFTETALDAAEKGFSRLTDGLNLIEKLNTTETSSFDVKSIVSSFYAAMNDDFNAPILIANLFDAVKQINLINDGNATISKSDKDTLEKEMKAFVFNVLGLEIAYSNTDSKLKPVMELVLDLRQQARANKDWTTSDKIRDGLAAAGIVVKDGKDGTTWSLQMKKLFFICLLISHNFFGQITGEWHSAFSVAGQNTRMDLFIDRVGRDGTLKIGLPDVSGFEPKTIENSTISKDSLSFTWENIGLSFNGKYEVKGDSLFGTMKQSGLEWKVTFKREIQVAKKLNRPQEPKPKFAYDIQEIVIKNGKNVIGATLTLPKGKTRFPIVILSSGSGPQNRDCEIMGHKPFWVIADYLTENGIGVLRFDDRGVGKSTGEFSKASLFDFASDVDACYRYVKKNFKGHKVGLAGHSEGGMHTLIVAANNPKLDFLIQLAAVGTNGREVLVDQQYLIPKSSGKSESYAKANSMVYDSVSSLLISNDNKSFPTELNNFLKRNFDQFPEDYKKEGTIDEFAVGLTNFLNNDWARQFVQFKSSDYLSKIYCPVLVINGSEDIQVPPIKNQDGFRNGRSTQSKSLNQSKIVLVPGLNHLMQSCKSCTIMEYGDLEETFSPIVLKSMADWINNPMLFEKH